MKNFVLSIFVISLRLCIFAQTPKWTNLDERHHYANSPSCVSSADLANRIVLACFFDVEKSGTLEAGDLNYWIESRHDPRLRVVASHYGKKNQRVYDKLWKSDAPDVWVPGEAKFPIYFGVGLEVEGVDINAQHEAPWYVLINWDGQILWQTRELNDIKWRAEQALEKMPKRDRLTGLVKADLYKSEVEKYAAHPGTSRRPLVLFLKGEAARAKTPEARDEAKRLLDGIKQAREDLLEEVIWERWGNPGKTWYRLGEFLKEWPDEAKNDKVIDTYGAIEWLQAEPLGKLYRDAMALVKETPSGKAAEKAHEKKLDAIKGRLRRITNGKGNDAVRAEAQQILAEIEMGDFGK